MSVLYENSDATALPTGIFATAYTWLPQARPEKMPLLQAPVQSFSLPDDGSCLPAEFWFSGIHTMESPLSVLHHAPAHHTEHTDDA